jgi:hypothetical protein
MIKKKTRKPRSRKPGAGRPTELTDEVFEKIRESIIEGNNLRTTANDLRS